MYNRIDDMRDESKRDAINDAIKGILKAMDGYEKIEDKKTGDYQKLVMLVLREIILKIWSSTHPETAKKHRSTVGASLADSAIKRILDKAYAIGAISSLAHKALDCKELGNKGGKAHNN